MVSHIRCRLWMKAHEVDADEKSTSESLAATRKRLWSLVLPSTEVELERASVAEYAMDWYASELLQWHTVRSTTI